MSADERESSETGSSNPRGVVLHPGPGGAPNAPVAGAGAAAAAGHYSTSQHPPVALQGRPQLDATRGSAFPAGMPRQIYAHAHDSRIPPQHQQLLQQQQQQQQQQQLLQARKQPQSAPPQQQPPLLPQKDKGKEETETITVKELMINVIEHSLSSNDSNRRVPVSSGHLPPSAGPGSSSSSSIARVIPAGGGASAHLIPHPQQLSATSPTIHTLLEESGPPNQQKEGAAYGGVGNRPRLSIMQLQQQQQHHHHTTSAKGSMAPPPPVAGAAPSLSSHPAAAAASAPPSHPPANDEGTLDLSMPRRRDVDATPPPAAAPVAPASQQLYREPASGPGSSSMRHARGSPSIDLSNSSASSQHQQAASRGGPPPAHSSSKVKVNPDAMFRGGDQRQAQSPMYGPDGRPLSTSSSHHLGHHRSTAQSPGLQHAAGAARSATSAGRPPMQASASASATSLQYIRQSVPTHPGASSKTVSMSPKPATGRVLTMQSGSITQGTPVNQAAALHRGGYDALIKMPTSDKMVGSITHGTPVYDKKYQQQHDSKYDRAASTSSADFYRRTVSPSTAYSHPASATASSQPRPSSYGSDQQHHISSRQVIMNDYAMARSTEMQRRPESREQHAGVGRPLSPPRLSSRDLSPRLRTSQDPRLMTDPRASQQHQQLDMRREGTAAAAARSAMSDPRYDPRAMDPRLLPDHRGDPKADIRALDHRSDHRVSAAHEVRTDPRISLEHRGDPRAGLEARSDLRLEHRGDPRAAIESRAADPRRLNDMRLVAPEHRSSGGGDSRAQLDARNPRSMSSYYAAAAAHGQPGGQAQLFMTADGKYVQSTVPASAASGLRDLHHVSRSRSPVSRVMQAAAVPSPPPQQQSQQQQQQMRSSAASVIQRSAMGGGITSGKPILSNKSSVPASHREVEIYRTNPEVTISKTTSSPRHIYNEQNSSLNSLADVALQHQKLPDLATKDRATAAKLLAVAHQQQQQAQQQHQQQVATSQRHAYERQMFELEKSRYNSSLVPPTSTARSAADTHPGASSAVTAAALMQQQQQQQQQQAMIVQQVQTERAKQKSLMQGNEKFEREVSSRQQQQQLPPQSMPGTSAGVAGKDDPSKGEETKSLSAAILIEAIISSSITKPSEDRYVKGTSTSNSQLGRTKAEYAASTPQEDILYKAQQQQRVANSPREPNGPQDAVVAASAGSGSAPGSRPGSRASSLEQAPGDIGNRNKSPVSIPEGTTPEQYWKRRGYMGVSVPNTSTAMAAPARPPPSQQQQQGVADERQITRVARTISPRSESSSASHGRPNIEPISPPNEPRRPPSNGSNSSSSLQQQQPQGEVGFRVGPDGKPVGSFLPLDYIKNRIGEVMKKTDAPGSSAVGGSAAGPTANSNSNAMELTAGKRGLVDDGQQGGVARPPPPDSPGSEGEMVIDETVRPDSVSSENTKNNSGSPVPSANATTAKSGDGASSAASAPPPAQPRYEPLSDDE